MCWRLLDDGNCLAIFMSRGWGTVGPLYKLAEACRGYGEANDRRLKRQEVMFAIAIS